LISHAGWDTGEYVVGVVGLEFCVMANEENALGHWRLWAADGSAIALINT
jgi:hypothetical protein